MSIKNFWLVSCVCLLAGLSTGAFTLPESATTATVEGDVTVGSEWCLKESTGGATLCNKSVYYFYNNIVGEPVVATNLIPAESAVYGTCSRVTNKMGISHSWNQGDGGGFNNEFCSSCPSPNKTTTDASNWTATPCRFYPSANNVELIAPGIGVFAYGNLRTSIWFYTSTAPTS